MNTDQYTIRKIPQSVTRVLKKRAMRTNKSFNQTVVDALIEQTNTSTTNQPNQADQFFGKLHLDEDFDQAIKQQSEVDEKLWQ